MPEGAALGWPLSDIVIRRKGRLAFRYRVPGCSLLDQWPEAALCSRWLMTRRMDEDAPFRSLPASPGSGARRSRLNATATAQSVPIPRERDISQLFNHRHIGLCGHIALRQIADQLTNLKNSR